MARFNEILAGRLNRAIQKFAGIKGSPPTPQLATEFIPVFPFFWGAENRYLEGWAIHSFETVIAALAANTNACQIRNPVGSGIIAVFIKVLCASGLSADTFILSLGPKTTDLPTPITLGAPSCFDTRFGATTRSALIASIQQAAGPGSAPPDRAFFPLASNQGIDFINDGVQEFPLLPGSALALRSTTTNNQAAFSLWWRERILEDSETS